MIWATDHAGEATYICPEWMTFTGQPVADALGFGWIDMLHPDDRSSTRATFVAATADVRAFRVRYRLRRRDLSWATIVSGAAPSTDPITKRFIGFLGSAVEVPDGYDEVLPKAPAKLIASPSSTATAPLTQLDVIAERCLHARAIAEELAEAQVCAALDFTLSLIFIRQGGKGTAKH